MVNVVPEPLVPGETVLQARNVSVRHDTKQLLTGVDLDLRAGEVLALLGPNGAGKSTLLSALSGETAICEGSISFLGKPLASWNLKQLARRRSVLLQEQQLMFPFAAYQVVEMGRAPWYRTAAESDDAEIIAESMALAQVSHLAQRRVPSLSGGERARVSFARTLATRANVVMLDEPTAALDLKHQESVLETMRDLAARGNAVVVVLHDLNLAGAYADTLTLLRQGELVASGSAREILTARLISDVYDTPVEVIAHPKTGKPLVLPLRSV